MRGATHKENMTPEEIDEHTERTEEAILFAYNCLITFPPEAISARLDLMRIAQAIGQAEFLVPTPTPDTRHPTPDSTPDTRHPTPGTAPFVPPSKREWTGR